MGIPWEKRAWEPKVGMKIWYRRDIQSNSDKYHRDREVVAEILEIHPMSKTLKVLRDRGRCRNKELKLTTWQRDWEPVPEPKKIESENKGRNRDTIDPIPNKQIVVRVEQESTRHEGGHESVRTCDELIDLYVEGSRYELAEALRNLAKLVSATNGNPIIRAKVMVLLDHPREAK